MRLLPKHWGLDMSTKHKTVKNEQNNPYAFTLKEVFETLTEEEKEALYAFIFVYKEKLTGTQRKAVDLIMHAPLRPVKDTEVEE